MPGLDDAALPLERLRMFLGPAIAAAATEMTAGSTTVYARQGRWYIIRVRRHENATRAELSAVRSQVLLDYRRQLADQLMRDYIAGLLRQADISIGPPR